MGYNKEIYKRIRAEYQTKPFAARAEADARRAELYAVIQKWIKNFSFKLFEEDFDDLPF